MASTSMPYLATAGADIKLWTVDSLTVNHQFSPHREMITSLSLSPDGNVSLCFCCFVCMFYILSHAVIDLVQN